MNPETEKRSTDEVLRALTELDGIKPEAVGPCDERFGSLDTITMSERDYRYSIALAVKQAQVNTYRKLMSFVADRR